MDFKKVDEQAKADVAGTLATEADAKAVRAETEAKNLADAEEWLNNVVIATLAKAKAQLSGAFKVDYHDDFQGVLVNSRENRKVTYSLGPLVTGKYAPLPHHLVVDKHRQMKCTSFSEWEDAAPKVVFSGNIDLATVGDFEDHISTMIKWWRSKGL